MRTSRKIGDKKNPLLEHYFNDMLPDMGTHQIPVLFVLTRRTVLFLFLYQTATVLFFLFGNFQRFLDENLLIILRTASATAVALTFLSIAGIIEGIIYYITRKNSSGAYYIFHSVCMLLTAAAGIINLFAWRAIDVLSQGILR